MRTGLRPPLALLLLLLSMGTLGVSVSFGAFPASGGALPSNSDPRTCIFERREGQYPDSLYPLLLETEHFRVRYTVTGPDSIRSHTYPHYVDRVAEGLEAAWRIAHERLALPAGLPGGGAGGEPGRIDCFLARPPSWTASAFVDSCEAEGACPGCRGGIVIHPTMGSSTAARAPAHEYFHLIQLALDPGEDSWFLESTAGWMEKLVSIKTWYVEGLGPALDTPFLPLWDARGYRAHGSGAYWAMLEETFGADLVAEVLRRCCGSDWLTALSELLEERGTSFNESLVKYALWCNATGPAGDGRHFRDGADFPPVRCQAKHRGFPVRNASVPPDSLARTAGSNFIRFYGPGTRDSLRVRFHGDPRVSGSRRVSLVVTRAGNRHEELTVATDAEGNAEFAVADWPGCAYATLIVTNFREAASGLEFTYDAEETGRAVLSSIGGISCRPNPFLTDAEITFRIRGAAQPPLVRVFDVSGRQVRVVPAGPTLPGHAAAIWDGKDEAGRTVPAGCYLVRAESGGAETSARLVRIR